MGCCEANDQLLFNKKSELNTRKENEEFLNKLKNNFNINDKSLSNINKNINMNNSDSLNELKLYNNVLNNHYNNLKKISNDIINTKQILELKVLESQYIKQNEILTINPGGLINSNRNAMDGITYFGMNNTDYINDYNFPENETNIGKRHFEIVYDLNMNEYKIKSLLNNVLYIKITIKTILKNNCIFSFSNTLINCNFKTNENLNGSIITLKILYGVCEGNEYTFDSNTHPLIKIGRLNTSEIDIEINDESTSRVQTSIFYENNNWYIIDGNKQENYKSSLNGTWLYANEYYTIFDGMIFRAGTTFFECNIKNNKNNINIE